MEELNSAFEKVCSRSNSVLIENDPSRLGDGDINAGFLQEDGHSLNTAGRDKLIKNLQLQGLVHIIKRHKAEKPKDQPSTKTSGGVQAAEGTLL